MAAASESKASNQHQFPCGQCGALLVYAPGTNFLRCGYCNNEEPVPAALTQVREHDFQSALKELKAAPRSEIVKQTVQVTRCDACGASFEFENDIHSGECPYCGHPIVLETGAEKLFKPHSLLPFKITEALARKHFRRWVNGLWFAPTGIKKYTRDESRLSGLYLPYWTYDSQTTTHYIGERGDVYQVPEQVVQVIQGRRVVKTVMVTKIRWTPVRGVVSRFFDDVLIGASRSLPRQITDRLNPWDLENLAPYQEEYLSGFGSQAYQVKLDEGFEYAREVMNGIIRGDIARDIGGDAQRIHRFETKHSQTTFKHILLPIWTAGFRFKGRVFHFVVNGRNGKVQGERPYSPWKIAFAVLIGIVLLVGGFYLFEYYQYQQATPIELPRIPPGAYRY